MDNARFKDSHRVYGLAEHGLRASAVGSVGMR